MTKRIIDADAVERLLINIMKRGFYNIMGVEHNVDVAVLRNILHKINELSTPAPEQEKSIFDADGWCWDMDSIPKDCKRILLACEYGITVGWRLPDGSIKSEFTDLHRGYQADWLAWRPLPPIPQRAEGAVVNKSDYDLDKSKNFMG